MSGIFLHDNTPFSGIQKKAYNLLSILNVLVLNITLRQVIVDPTPITRYCLLIFVFNEI
jgi:hypothetical protein